MLLRDIKPLRGLRSYIHLGINTRETAYQGAVPEVVEAHAKAGRE
jgi:hypothetical protein